MCLKQHSMSARQVRYSRYENRKETDLCSTDSKLDGLMSSPMGISSMIELKFAKSSPSL